MARRSRLVSIPFAFVGLFAVLTVPGLARQATAQIRINEVLPNPTGDDVGTERIEIYNAGATPIDVTGWAIDDAATFDEVGVRARLPEDFDTSVCSGSAIILPGEFRVIKGLTTAPYLNNGGDDVYLITNRTQVPPPVEHQVTYGATIEAMSWAAVPNGSTNFAWRTPSMCGSNGGAGDATPPNTVADLLASAGSFPGEVVLTWTAPGDDGASGTASDYRIKVAYAPINDLNFDSAADLERWTQEPLPILGGSPQTWTVFGMDPDSTYHFALKAIDEASNVGGVSNSTSTAPAAGTLLEPNLGFETYFGNLHSHTGFSDGMQTPADAYSYARNTAPTPLDFLAVTEHNHSTAGMSLANYDVGRAQAAAANDDGDFVAIFGQEWGFAASGHVNVFETEDLFGWEPGNHDVFVAEGDYPSLYSAILANPPDQYPAIAEWCHPASGDFGGFAQTPAGKSVVRLMALVNGPAMSVATDESDVGNTNVDGLFALVLQAGWRVSPVADQDNHSANWGAATQSRTGVLAGVKTKAALLDAMAARRTYATMDHNTVIQFSADGHAMGEAFTSAAGVRISARVVDPDVGDSPTLIELFRGVTGGAVATMVGSNIGNHDFHWREVETFTTGTEAHYYLRIKINGTRTIWTGPVYVTYDPSTPVAVGDPGESPLAMAAPYPNPGRGAVSVRFSLASAESRVRLGVFDITGRLVRSLVDGPLAAGERNATWDGTAELGQPVQSGVYFLRLDTGAQSLTRKLLYLR
jgi:hypothetical protein